MKKLVKLIVLVVVLGLLIAGYSIYNAYTNNQFEDEEPEEDLAVEVLKIDTESIVSIEYVFEDEQVVLKKTEEKWQWENDADFPIDQTVANNMAKSLSNIIATRLIAETTEKQADYGLDAPEFTVKFTTKSGQNYDYYIGNYNSVAEGYYAKISGQDKIYLMSNTAKESFLYTVMDMIENDKLPTVDSEKVTLAEVKGSQNLFITTSNEGADFYSEPYTFFTKNSDNVVSAVDAKAGAEFISAIAELSFDGAIKFKPDNDTLSLYGLSEDKRIQLVVNYDEAVETEESDTNVEVSTSKSYSLYIGKHTNEEGTTGYYAMLEGSNIVYKLKGGEAFYKSLEADFESKLVCPVSKEKALSIKAEIKKSSKVYSYTMVDIEKKEELISIYNKLTSLVFSEKKADATKGEIVFTAEFEVSDKTLALNVYKYDDKNYVASFDKFDNMLVSAESVDEVIKAFEEYNK